MHVVREIAVNLAIVSRKPFIKVLMIVLPRYINRPLTLSDVGILLGLSRERVRQIQHKAFDKITELDLAALEEIYFQTDMDEVQYT